MPQEEDKGGSVSVTETPEFKAAVDAAVAAALANFAPAVATQGGEVRELVNGLAVQLAKFTGQGIGQHYLDPEIGARREEASRQLRALLDELRAKGDEPQWKLVGQVHMSLGAVGYAIVNPYYRDPSKRQQQTEIGFYGVPNLAMRPLNPAAERVWRLFTQSIGRTETGDDDVEDWEVTQSGATIRKGLKPPSRDASAEAFADGDGVRILQGDDPSKRKVQVFTAMPAIEMAERAG